MPRNKINILSIDGGGIRGIIPATVLVHIEKRIREEKGDDKRIADYVDMVAGTSTGAILGAMLLVPDENGRPKFTAEDALEFYVRHGEEIFNRSIRRKYMAGQLLFGAAKYSERRLEILLKEKLGDFMISQLLKPCIITSYNMYNRSAVFFNSREKKSEKGDFLVREVLRSTSAAPTYFNPAFMGFHTGKETDRMVNLDGGVFANNPAMCAYAEARGKHFPDWPDDEEKRYPTARNMHLLSLGTGGGYADLGKTPRATKWGLLNWAKKTPDIMMDGALNTVNYQVQKLFESLDGEEVKNYKRVDYPKPSGTDKPPYEPDMADASRRNIDILLECGQQTVEHGNLGSKEAHTLDIFVDKMLDVFDE